LNQVISLRSGRFRRKSPRDIHTHTPKNYFSYAATELTQDKNSGKVGTNLNYAIQHINVLSVRSLSTCVISIGTYSSKTKDAAEFPHYTTECTKET
jgi:hypothetical protein